MMGKEMSFHFPMLPLCGCAEWSSHWMSYKSESWVATLQKSDLCLSFMKELKLTGLNVDSTPQGQTKHIFWWKMRWGIQLYISTVPALFISHACVPHSLCLGGGWNPQGRGNDVMIKDGTWKGIQLYQLCSSKALSLYTCMPSSYFSWCPQGEGWTSSLEQALILI